MKALPNRFPDAIVDAIRACQVLGIRAGRAPHRVIAIWAVVVERRVFVRSWSLKPRSWYRTFLEDPYGVIQIEGRELKVRAVRTRSDRLKDAVSRAYREKYPHAWRAQVRPRPRAAEIARHHDRAGPGQDAAHGQEVRSRRMAPSRVSSISFSFFVRSPIGYRAYFSREDGRWQMLMFIAGD